TEEAIGNPESDDFPIQKGRERLMQAEFGNGIGQAFTDRYGDFEGTFKDIIDMPMTNNYRRGIFIAALNAVLNHRGLIQGTIHCRDQEPMQCARELAGYIRGCFGDVKIGLVGFQPRMAEILGAGFPIRLMDLDPDNIGTRKFGITVEGEESTEDVIAWADLLLVTGTTLVNNTIETFLDRKPILFYGTTIAGAAHLMGWERFCACSS
ncbi:Rossmann-like domain-containing protein, partial [Thermodesulfobacteriota bacterium]